MGKTLAFYFALFWHWNIGDTDPANERIVLIIGPLNALMQGQVETLTLAGVPSVFINSQTPNKIDAMKDVGAGTDSSRSSAGRFLGFVA